MENSRLKTLYALCLALSFGLHSQDEISRFVNPDQASSYELYQNMRYEAFDHSARTYLPVKDVNPETNNGRITFGAEKEGSTSRLTRVAGPMGSRFSRVVKRMMPDDQREVFLKAFLSELQELGDVSVTSLDGQVVTSVAPQIGVVESARLEALEEAFEAWLESTQNRPFSFMPLPLRKRIYDAAFPGIDTSMQEALRDYPSSWIAHFGMPEKYIGAFSKQNTIPGGWEINFSPQQSYSEFEEMISWFKEVMAPKGQVFQAPGHHRLVFPTPKFTTNTELQKFRKGLAEVYRLSQAFAILRGIRGKTGINVGQWKSAMPDTMFSGLNTRANHIFRLEVDYIAKDTMSLEMRAGTKDAAVQRLIQHVVSSRIATHDFEDLKMPMDWKLLESKNTGGGYPTPVFNKESLYRVSDIQERFDVSQEMIQKAFENIKSVENTPKAGDIKTTYVQPEFWVPFWNWEEAPFISDLKKEHLKKLTQSFILSMASLEKPDLESVQELFSDWVKISKLPEDIEAYLRPKPHFSQSVDLDKVKVKAGAFDVNKVDLGVEFTGRFPIQNEIHFTDTPLIDGKYHWLATAYDLTQEEREDSLKALANELAKEFGRDEQSVQKIKLDEGHGHGLGLAYEVTDSTEKKWRVEWDGIGRTYDKSGKLIENSARGGHIEIVTPKSLVDFSAAQSVYRALDQVSLLPKYSMGGSHINVDLKAFENNPRALARFISLFHQHRGIISLLFQHPARVTGSEPAKVSEYLARELSDFTGTEKELKQLLYNERYFNTRVGRKTRYQQLDLSAFFQDIIPDEFISEDFDISSPAIPWRRQFRVDPKIRKMEFRLFGAAESEYEAALQIKLVRALLNKAINDDGVLSGQVQQVNYRTYLENPQRSWDDLRAMADDLDLNANDYKQSLGRSLQASEEYFLSIYPKYDEKLKAFPRFDDWGEAMKEERATGLSSKKRAWFGEVLPEARSLQNQKQQIANEVENLRKASVITKRVRLARDEMSCTEIFKFLVNSR